MADRTSEIGFEQMAQAISKDAPFCITPDKGIVPVLVTAPESRQKMDDDGTLNSVPTPGWEEVASEMNVERGFGAVPTWEDDHPTEDAVEKAWKVRGNYDVFSFTDFVDQDGLIVEYQGTVMLHKDRGLTFDLDDPDQHARIAAGISQVCAGRSSVMFRIGAGGEVTATDEKAPDVVTDRSGVPVESSGSWFVVASNAGSSEGITADAAYQAAICCAGTGAEMVALWSTVSDSWKLFAPYEAPAQ